MPGEYILPYRSPLNQPKPSRWKLRRKGREQVLEKARRTAEAQRELPSKIRELFTRRQDLMNVIEEAYPAKAKRRGGDPILSMPGYAYSDNFQGIIVTSVHPWKKFASSVSSYGISNPSGWESGFNNVIIQQNGLIRHPNVIDTTSYSVQPCFIQPVLERNCSVMVGYSNPVRPSAYPYAINLAKEIDILLDPTKAKLLYIPDRDKDKIR